MIARCPIRRLALLGPAPPDRGGIAHETARLARELSALVAVDYFTFSRPYPRWLDPRRFDRDARLPEAPAIALLDYRSPRSWRGSAERIAETGGEALLVPWWTSFWAFPIRAILRRLAVVAPGMRRLLLCHNLKDHEGGAIKDFLTLGAFSAAEAFLVHSESDRVALLRRFPGSPVCRAPLPALEAPRDRGQARRVLSIEGPLVLFLGLVRRYKGVDTLLEAAPRIVRKTGARVAVVGEVFSDARDLEKRRRASPVADRILWKDEYVSEEEMALWLAACDVVVLPYREISGSAIAARAIGARRPIAAASTGGLADVVIAGVTGELFVPGDADGLARAVECILARGFEAYAPGLEAAAMESSWPNYARRILSFVSELTADSGGF